MYIFNALLRFWMQCKSMHSRVHYVVNLVLDDQLV